MGFGDNEMINIFFRSKLVMEMDKRGMTIGDLSRLSGIGYDLLYKYVKGHRTPTLYTAAQIAYALGCDIKKFTT